MASIGDRKSKEKRGGITRRSIKDGEVIGKKLHPHALSGDHLLYHGAGQPLLVLADMSALASGADATEHIAFLPGGGTLHYTPNGVFASVLGPMANANGLEISMEDTDDKGANYVPGGLFGAWRMTVESTSGQEANVPKGIFIRLRVLLQDVSGTDDFAVGIRKAEAVQALVDDYDEAAYVNVISGDVKTETILNNGATATVDSGENWADNETHEIEVRCEGNGKVEFWFDGEPLPISQVFQFDDAEVVVPFIYFLNAADKTELYIKKLECGTLEQV